MTPIQIFVNLKRFDIPRRQGGVCPVEDPAEWISTVLRRSAELGLGASTDLVLTFLLPEALIVPARLALESLPPDSRSSLVLGCQGVYREDVAPGGNFGAFTTNLPATAAANLGCNWAMVGHSEERRDKLGVIEAFQDGATDDPVALEAVDRLIGAEATAALAAGLDVLLCVGETASQRSQIEEVIGRQIGLGVGDNLALAAEGRFVIGYEPIWAIGPGKTPPEPEEIGRIAGLIQDICLDRIGVSIPVVYGGGLKRENAEGIAAQEPVDGGLVALTRFSGEIGFDPEGLADIVQSYRAGLRNSG